MHRKKQLGSLIEVEQCPVEKAVRIAEERGLPVSTVRDSYSLFSDRAERVMNTVDMSHGAQPLVPLAVSTLRIDLKAVETLHAKAIDDAVQQATNATAAALVAIIVAAAALLIVLVS